MKEEEKVEEVVDTPSKKKGLSLAKYVGVKSGFCDRLIVLWPASPVFTLF